MNMGTVYGKDQQPEPALFRARKLSPTHGEYRYE